MIKEMKESNKKLQEDLRRLSDKWRVLTMVFHGRKRRKLLHLLRLVKTDIFIDLKHALSLCFQNCVRKVYKSLSQEDQWKIS